MDFGAKNREKLSSSYSHDLPFFFFHEKNPKTIDESYLQIGANVFHPHDFHPPTCNFEYPFENHSPIFDFYETKPFENHNGALIIPFMDQNGPSQMVNHYEAHSPFEMGFIKYGSQDEGSSTSTNNDIMVTNYPSSLTMVKKQVTTQKKKKTNVIKGQWTIEEDRVLIKLVERFGVRKWAQIAELVGGRIGKQCRERWHNHLKPNIKKDLWSEEEDRILIKAHKEIGNKWAEIAKRLQGRTENSIKNHWNATKRKQLSKRRCRSKYPSQSLLLQEYINTLDLEIVNAGSRKKNPISNYEKTDSKIGYSSDSNSSGRLGHYEYAFSEVPDFNFDARMLEDSSIDSLLG